MVLVGVRNEPQGPAYLPPSSRPAAGGGGTGHPDDWAGVSMYYGIVGQKNFLPIREKKKARRSLIVRNLSRINVYLFFFFFLFLKYNFDDIFSERVIKRESFLNKIDIGSGELRILVRGSRRGGGSGLWSSRDEERHGGDRDLSRATTGR